MIHGTFDAIGRLVKKFVSVPDTQDNRLDWFDKAVECTVVYERAMGQGGNGIFQLNLLRSSGDSPGLSSGIGTTPASFLGCRLREE